MDENDEGEVNKTIIGLAINENIDPNDPEVQKLARAFERKKRQGLLYQLQQQTREYILANWGKALTGLTGLLGAIAYAVFEIFKS